MRISRPRNKRGQYRKSYLRRLLPLFILLATVFACYYFQPSDGETFSPRAELISPLPESRLVELAQAQVIEVSPTPTPTQAPTSEKQEIMHLIIDAFGDASPKAIAVAKAESGLDANKEVFMKAGHYSWSSPTYPGECSVGIFMINLAEDGCKGKWVHASKVPGETIEEKIEWLKIPENNIDFAKEYIFEKSGWNPWSAYTNGSYKNL